MTIVIILPIIIISTTTTTNNNNYNINTTTKYCFLQYVDSILKRYMSKARSLTTKWIDA